VRDIFSTTKENGIGKVIKKRANTPAKTSTTLTLIRLEKRAFLRRYSLSTNP
jgi:hypothetical protein